MQKPINMIAASAAGILAVALLAFAAVTAASPDLPDPAQSNARAMAGLREAPNIPVASVFLRHDFPDHPLGGPPGLERPAKGGGCDKGIDLTSTASGVVPIAAQDNSICTNADIDTLVRNPKTYAVQAGGDDAAWTQTDVSDPSNPSVVGQFIWVNANGTPNRHTYTPDIKAFHQGDSDYIAMGLERRTLNGFCGVVIMDVTNPSVPVKKSQYIGSTSNQNLGPFWCDTHNVFVEDDEAGNGRFIYATADGPNDMRVLDISGANSDAGGNSSSVSNPVEIGRYAAPGANNDNYVHDITVLNHGGAVGRRAYLAYWESGVVVLNAAGVTPGVNPAPVVGPNKIDPAGFRAHHAFANQAGDRVFTQDEFLNSNGDQPVQMWEFSDPLNPTNVDGLVLGIDVPANPAHNLEIRFDIDPDRLYVGWYKLGLQAWDFTNAGFDHSANPAPRTAAQYHQAQTELDDEAYSGAWGIKMENITVGGVTKLYLFQSDRNYGLIIDCVSCAAPPAPPPPAPATTGAVNGKVTSSAGGNLGGVLVEIVTTALSDTTNKGGRYGIREVPAGGVTVKASKSDYTTKEQFVTVVAGQTTTVNFTLDPSP